MTVSYECDHKDFFTVEDLISKFSVTNNVGISRTKLERFELAACRDLYRIHCYDHQGHSAKYSFSVPEGYQETDGVIFRCENQT